MSNFDGFPGSNWYYLHRNTYVNFRGGEGMPICKG